MSPANWMICEDVAPCCSGTLRVFMSWGNKQSMTRKQHVLWQCRATRKLTLQRAANEKHFNSTNLIFEPAGDRELSFSFKETSLNCVWTTSQQKYCLLDATVGHVEVFASSWPTATQRGQRSGVRHSAFTVSSTVKASWWAATWGNGGHTSGSLG